MAESNVAISPDSASVGAHNIRTVTVNVDNSAAVAGGQPEQQQVVTLAGSDGQFVNMYGGALQVTNEEIVSLLYGIVTRLDILNALVDSKYEPPDKLSKEI